jgi:DNA-binding Lrp family transcriptional regulator
MQSRWKMNDLTSKIIKLLKRDSRLTPEVLSAMLNENIDKITSIIKDLEDKGVIVKYFTLINDEKIDDNDVEALIEVKVTPKEHNGFDDIANEIKKYTQVSNVSLLSGSYDLLVTIKGRSIKDVALFVSEKLSTMENVLSTATHFILKKYKVEGVCLDEEEETERLKIQL